MSAMVNVFAALTALSYGAADFAGGMASRKTSVSSVVVWSQCIGILTALAVLPLIGGARISLEAWFWGMAAGISGAAGLSFIYRGLAAGLAAVVSPSAAVTGAVLPLLFGVIFGERPAPLIWGGVVLVVPAILLLSIERGDSRGRVLESMRIGVIAGLGFGGFFVLISRGGDESGLWPLVAARSAGVPLLLIVSLICKQSLVLEKGSRMAALGAGVMDMAANVFFLLSVRGGMLITASVIAALYPAPTVMLQRIVFGEKLGTARIAGLILALTGIALIGAG